ncbi:LytTR family transcriptional regulator DNA-binding domain-containing protein [Alkalihalobacillus trypoxylicola]|uniref:ABC transporter ATP-binding protein n=1 Tax=Alkalihalobacillus trypoxylicola TaxID=519424 RepID=A0A161Q250_9BACI|nr:LytTR family transcriptional regulator DNA-binding domain-containing protein [Alkalihalobacillus trypoxylicola]KYG29613.1 ABC transporter ATP-binding protein [Alkalihalobacillus trypoxylicola]
MTLVKLVNVLKQEGNRTIIKNVNLEVKESARIGIKMSGEESEILFDLIEGKQIPSSGEIEREIDSILSEKSDDGLYESLTVQSYLKFYKKIAGFTKPLEEYIATFSLSDVWQTKIKRLTREQRKRVSLYRLYLFSPQLILLEDPLNNLTDEGIELYLKALEHLRSNQIATLITSNYVEDLLLLSGEIYRYNHLIGLEKTDYVEESDVTSQDKPENETNQPKNVFKVTCKMADKTIFFSPDEIDYIESINSVSHIRIDNESFPTDLTMNQLEEKLRTFGFFRCHRSYLVNLQRVSELISYSKNSYTLILKGNPHAKLPLSRNRLEEMKSLITF